MNKRRGHRLGQSATFYCVFLLCLVLVACGTTPTAAPATSAPQEPPQAATSEPVAAATESPTEPAAPAVTQKKVLTILFTQEFDSLNPLYTNMWFSTVTHQLWLAWAWDFDEQNQAAPRLVTEIPTMENGGISPDGRVITMTLRSDIKWSDNTPITADDFIFTYQMAIEPKNTVASAYPYDKVSTMTAPDPQTVVITFEEPYAPWLAHFWRGILPSHILKPIYEQDGTLDKASWNLEPTVGCGPYIFDTWETGSFARFVINPNYWGAKPKIDEIFIRFVPDDSAQTAALKAGDGDIGAFIPYSDVPSLKDAGLTIATVQTGMNEGWFFMVNEEKSNPGLMDVRVRKAVAMALNKEKLNKDLLYGLTNVPNSYWDALPFWNNPPVAGYPYDPEGAKKLLDEAGWVDSNGDGTRDKDGVELVLTHGTTIREIRQNSQAIAQQELAEVGIKLETSSYDDTTYFSGYGDNGPAATGKLDIMEWSDGPMFPDPDIYYWLCSEIPSDENPVGTNWMFICDEELDQLIKVQISQVNQDERQKTISKINQLFQDKVYWIGLWQDPDVWAVGPKVAEYKFSGVTPFYTIENWDMK